jgi:hypothetical protein
MSDNGLRNLDAYTIFVNHLAIDCFSEKCKNYDKIQNLPSRLQN